MYEMVNTRDHLSILYIPNALVRDGASQPGYPSWPALGEILLLLLCSSKFHLGFIWEPSWPA